MTHPFFSAPDAIQAQFMRRISVWAARESDFDRYLQEVEDDDPTPPRDPRRLTTKPTWSRSWERRAQTPDEPDPRRALESLDLTTCWEQLTGIELPPNRMTSCPTPDHDDTNPSCSVGPERWRCFGCGSNGTVIDLGSVIFGIEPYGAGFFELRKKILDATGNL